MYKWKRSKGMGNVCSKCNKVFSDSEFNADEDLCDYCLFPETSMVKPAEMKYYYGDPKNMTDDEELLSNIENVPEKQSPQAIASKREFEYSKYRKL